MKRPALSILLPEQDRNFTIDYLLSRSTGCGQNMRFARTQLDGAWLIHIEPVEDSRGYFARTFSTDEFRAHHLETNFPQHSISCSSRAGTIRGMHFQRKPHGEVKLVRCVAGAVWDVIIDIRSDSATFGSWEGFELSETNRQQIYIPEGFAHGFQTLTDNAQVNYLISTPYTPVAADGLRHDDVRFDITWPLPVTAISDKDLTWPLFADRTDLDGTLSSSSLSGGA